MAKYKGVVFGEQSPHPFAIAGYAYRYLVADPNFLSLGHQFQLFFHLGS
jgi:hypothetical protein